MKTFLLSLIFFISLHVNAQQIFSETDFGYSKAFAPYEVHNIYPLPDKDFVILREEGNGEFRLIRYDKYMLEKWAVELDFGKDGTFPKLIKREDRVVVFRVWKDKGEIWASTSSHDLSDGHQLFENKKVIFQSDEDLASVKMSFGEEMNSFLLYNLPEGNGKSAFSVFDIISLDNKVTYSLPSSSLQNKSIGIWLRENADLFVALADAGTFTLETYFFTLDTKETPVVLSGNFSFDRPADALPDVKVIPQSESTYFVACSANIEEELVGMNISSFNVVLKSVLFSNSLNFNREFILNAYSKSLFTSDNQKKKYITTPESLEEFHLQQLIKDENGDITCIFEKQELASAFHTPSDILNMPLKYEEGDKVYQSEDLLFVSFSSEGIINWKSVIQKTQKGYGHGLTTSYLPRVKDDTLELIMFEAAKGNSLYRIDKDLTNGGILNVYSFFDKKTEFNKNYSTWLDDKTLLLCAFKPGSNKRKFYVVEF